MFSSVYDSVLGSGSECVCVSVCVCSREENNVHEDEYTKNMGSAFILIIINQLNISSKDLTI